VVTTQMDNYYLWTGKSSWYVTNTVPYANINSAVYPSGVSKLTLYVWSHMAGDAP